VNGGNEARPKKDKGGEGADQRSGQGRTKSLADRKGESVDREEELLMQPQGGVSSVGKRERGSRVVSG